MDVHLVAIVWVIRLLLFTPSSLKRLMAPQSPGIQPPLDRCRLHRLCLCGPHYNVETERYAGDLRGEVKLPVRVNPHVPLLALVFLWALNFVFLCPLTLLAFSSAGGDSLLSCLSQISKLNVDIALTFSHSFHLLLQMPHIAIYFF